MAGRHTVGYFNIPIAHSLDLQQLYYINVHMVETPVWHIGCEEAPRSVNMAEFVEPDDIFSYAWTSVKVAEL